MLRFSPYPVKIRENADQKNSEYGHFPYKESYKPLAIIYKSSHPRILRVLGPRDILQKNCFEKIRKIPKKVPPNEFL